MANDRSGQEKRVIELRSMVSSDELAAGLVRCRVAMSKRRRSAETWAETMQHMGLPKGGTSAYEEMIEDVNSGWTNFGVHGGTSRRDNQRGAGLRGGKRDDVDRFRRHNRY